MWTNPGIIKIAYRHMDVEIWTEAAQFPEKEYINGIFLAVLPLISCLLYCRKVTGFNYDNLECIIS
jgi:hypothetical protein